MALECECITEVWVCHWSVSGTEGSVALDCECVTEVWVCHWSVSGTEVSVALECECGAGVSLCETGPRSLAQLHHYNLLQRLLQLEGFYSLHNYREEVVTNSSYLHSMQANLPSLNMNNVSHKSLILV